MPSTTPLFGFPYPVGTDRVTDGDNAIEALARGVETQLSGGGATVSSPYRMHANQATITNPASNTGVTLAVTFPVGRFTIAPVVLVTGVGSGYTAASQSVVTTAGFNAKLFNPTGTTPTGSLVAWIAVQMTTTTGPGFAARSEQATNITVTCHTPGCGNADQAIALHLAPETSDVACGVCGNPITDTVTA
jgi:hypothetical protein